MPDDSFEARFKQLREAAGLTRTALAVPRYTVSFVSQIEAGRRRPSAEALSYFARRLGVTETYLATGRPDALADRFRYKLESARRHLESGDSPAALDQASQLLDDIASHGLDELRPGALLISADALRLLGRPREAIDHYEEALESGLLTERERAIATRSLAEAYRTLGDLSYAAELIESYLRPTRSEPFDPAVLADLQNALASIYFERGDIYRAERAAARALAAIEAGQSPALRAQVMWTASRVVAESGRWRDALDLANRARAIIEDLHDQRRLGLVHNACAFLCLEVDPPRTAEARRHLEIAEAILTPLAVPGDLASVYSERARLALLDGDPGDAHAYSERAALEAGENQLALARCLFTRGRALAEMGRRGEALGVFEDAAAVFEKCGARQQAASCWHEIGELQLLAGDTEAALESLRSGLQALEPRRARA
jgi:tetratricopeptide (TPR) repeat protein